MGHALPAADCSFPVATQPTMVDRPAIAEVIVPRHLNRSFTYAIPEPLRDHLQVGSRVLIPFGTSMLKGGVVALSARCSHGDPQDLVKSDRSAGRLRETAADIDDIPEAGLTPTPLNSTPLVAERS